MLESCGAMYGYVGYVCSVTVCESIHQDGNGKSERRCTSFELRYGYVCVRDLRVIEDCIEWRAVDVAVLPLADVSPELILMVAGMFIYHWLSVIRFGKKEKLTPRYVGPFEILERIGPVAYRLKLHEELSGVHDMFHVSNLKKCLADASLHVLLDEIKVDKTLRFVEEPVEIMDSEVKRLKRSKISLVKVRWDSKRGPEFTWECEDYMKSKYPRLFVDRSDKSAS
ncbi:hypothetical protein Tco_1144410 [Tanacetum coccineum]